MIGPEIHDFEGRAVTPEPMMPFKTNTDFGPVNVSISNTIIVESSLVPNFVVVEHTLPSTDVESVTKRFLAISIGDEGMDRLRRFGVETITTDEAIPDQDIEWYDETLFLQADIDLSSLQDITDQFSKHLARLDPAIRNPQVTSSNPSLSFDLGILGLGLLCIGMFDRGKK